ncbi:MAG TPA: hypothetical protein DD670_05525 [Planctomycetaceae bacterium]|nr:hypothetical protein [Planctomycetaceae bacterium]
MLLKLFFRTAVLAAAVIGPMLFYSVSDIWASAKSAVSTLTGGGNQDQSGASSVAPPMVSSQAMSNLPPLEGPEVGDFGEVFRFDATVPWIMSRWSRVSTGMAQLQLHGYRVPLVTGTRPDDLAGALTYYYGPDQRVRKITFNGTTGDAGRLVHFLASRYGFQRRLANDGGLFVYEVPNEKGDIHSVLRIRSTGIVRADQPNQRFHVDLVIEPPQKG